MPNLKHPLRLLGRFLAEAAVILFFTGFGPAVIVAAVEMIF